MPSINPVKFLRRLSAQQSATTTLTTLDYVGIAIAVIVFVITMITILILGGCAGAHRTPLVKIDGSNIARITYNPKQCKRLVDGRVLCEHVLFTEKTVSVEKLKLEGR